MSQSAKQAERIQQPKWLLPSKLFRQKPQDWQIPREHALDKLEAALNHRLIIFHAPAGYGKSTVLAQWGDRLSIQGVHVAWLMLDEADRDPLTFLSYVLAAVEAREQPDGVIENRFSRSRGDAAVERILAHLVAKAFESTTDMLIVMEDYHRCDRPEISKIMDQLVRLMPSRCRFAIATREVPLIQTSVLRARGDIFELGPTEFRFTIDETNDFMNAKLPGELTTDQVGRLWEVTEGWPLAIQTARLWLSDGRAKLTSIDAFSGRIKDIADYLNEQVMESLSTNVQNFLLQTSVLERMSGDIANHVCERDDSWQILEYLSKRNLFLISEDDEGRWYRYHQLFSEFLREQLKREDAASFAIVTKRAAEWYADNGYLREAIRTYLGAGDVDEAAELIELSGGWRLLYRAHTGVLREFFDQVDESLVQRYPRLYLTYICVLIKSGQMETAEHHLQCWDGSRFAEGQNSLLSADRLFVGTLLADYRESPSTDVVVSGLRNTLVAVNHGDNLLKSMLYHQLCNSCFELCQFDAARDAAEKSKQYLEAGGSHYATYTLDLCLGQILQYKGDLSRAIRVFETICSDMHGELGDDSDAVCIARISLASALYEQNKISLAKAHLDESLVHAEQFDGWYSVYAAAYEASAGIALRQQGIDAALNVWRQACEVAEKRDLWKLALFSKYRRVLLHLSAGEHRSAKSLLVRLESTVREESALNQSIAQTLQIRHIGGETAARFAIVGREFELARDVVTPLIEESEKLAWHSQTARLLILRTQIRFGVGQKEEAYSDLSRALELASTGPSIRMFLDEPADFLAHIRHASAVKDVLSAKAYKFAKLLLSEAVVQGDHDHGGTRHQGYGKRELETLQLLCEGLSNKQMAFKLGISESTVKFHRKNVYKKLGANNRASAIAEARRLSLV